MFLQPLLYNRDESASCSVASISANASCDIVNSWFMTLFVNGNDVTRHCAGSFIMVPFTPATTTRRPNKHVRDYVQQALTLLANDSDTPGYATTTNE